jgi:hypothetical protein
LLMVDWWQAVSEVGPERPKIRKSIKTAQKWSKTKK